MENFNCKGFRLFWGEVVKMWSKEHGFTLGNCLKASFYIAIISIVGYLLSIYVGKEEWQKIVSVIALGISGIVAFVNFFFILPCKKYLMETNKLNARIKELQPLEDYKKAQEGNEQDWLHLVVNAIDLQKYDNLSERHIQVNFSFDSGLVYPFKPYKIWLYLTLDGYPSQEPQHEIIQTYELQPGQRSNGNRIPVQIKDDKLLEIVRNARQGKKIQKALRIAMQLRANEPIKYFEGELVD